MAVISSIQTNIFSLLFMLLPAVCLAQTETIFNIEVEPNSYWRSSSQLYGNNLIFNSSDTIWKVDTETGAFETLASIEGNLSRINHSSEGAFFTTYEENETGNYYNLNYVDLDGELMDSARISEVLNNPESGYAPKHHLRINDQLFFNGFLDNQHCVWQSDGTESGTQIILQSTDPIIRMSNFEDELLIIQEADLNYTLHVYSSNNTLTEISVLSKDNFYSNFRSVARNSGYFYFNVQDSLDDHSIYRIDSQGSLELFTPHNCSKLKFEGENFIAHIPDGWQNKLLMSGTLENPSELELVPLNEDFDSDLTAITLNYGDNFYRIQSIASGLELVRINSENELEFINTSIPGPESPLPYNIDEYETFGLILPESIFLEDANNGIYTILTNGADDYYYMYYLNGAQEQSLFRVEHPDKVIGMFLHEEYIYWFEPLEERLSLKRRNLTANYESQPSPEDIPDEPTWFRQLALGIGDAIPNAGSTLFYPQQVFLDSSVNTIVGGSLRWWSTSAHVMSSDTNYVLRPKGSSIYAKYDPYGNMQWINGIGDNDGITFSKNKFTVRENGNVVILGSYHEIGYFDSDSLTSDGSGYFLTELDYETGRVIWKKQIAEALNDGYMITDGVTVDSSGNIYIAFRYYNFQTSIDGLELSYFQSPANAVAKFDSIGNALWAKNTETPWEDNYGINRIIEYNEQFQTLTVAQSSGFYNAISSCEYRDWDNYIQEFDVNGTLINSYGFYSSDLGALTVGMRTNENLFFGMGFYRATLEAGPYSTTTEPNSWCFKNEGFGIIHDHEMNEILEANTTENNAFYPLDMASSGGNFYVLGANELDTLHLLKFTNAGKYLGYKSLNQKLDVFDFEYWNYLDVSADYIVITGANFHKDEALGVLPRINSLPSISVLKIENSEWIEDESMFEEVAIKLEANSEVLIYPNPFNDVLNLTFSGKDMSYTTFDIVDYTGRIIKTGELNSFQTQQIYPSQLSPGSYFITFRGEGSKLVKQLIKL